MTTVLPFGATVTLKRRTVTGTDGRGNDTYSSVDVVVTNCAIHYGTDNEIVQGTEEVVQDVVVWFPTGTVVKPIDQMLLPDGNLYQVEGSGNQDTSPWSGVKSWVEVRGRYVTGASV